MRYLRYLIPEVLYIGFEGGFDGVAVAGVLGVFVFSIKIIICYERIINYTFLSFGSH